MLWCGTLKCKSTTQGQPDTVTEGSRDRLEPVKVDNTQGVSKSDGRACNAAPANSSKKQKGSGVPLITRGNPPVAGEAPTE